MPVVRAGERLGPGDRDGRGTPWPGRWPQETSSSSPVKPQGGKTTFVRGACRTLGVNSRVTQPDLHDRPPLRRDGRRLAPRPLPLPRPRGCRVGRSRAPLRRRRRISSSGRRARAGALPRPRASVRLEHVDRDARRIVVAADDRALLEEVAGAGPAFDTATDVATSALRRRRRGPSASARPSRRRAARGRRRAAPAGLERDFDQLDALVVGTRPGSFTAAHRPGGRPRAGCARRRGRGGVDAGRAGRGRGGLALALPVIDARRGEVFLPGGLVAAPEQVDAEGQTCVGSGAVRYRDVLEARGGVVPVQRRPRHVPRAVLHARIAGTQPSGRSMQSSRSTCGRGRGAVAAMIELELRRLALADLDAIERIERACTGRRGRGRCSPRG